MKPVQVVDSQVDLIHRINDSLIYRAWVLQLMNSSAYIAHQVVNGPYGKREQGMSSSEANAAAVLTGIRMHIEHAEAYWVSADMGLLIEHAAGGLDPDERLQLQLMPSEAGLVRLERPLKVQDVRGVVLNLSWLSWGPVVFDNSRMHSGEPIPNNGLALGMWSDMWDHPDDITRQLLQEFGKNSPAALKFGRWGMIGCDITWQGKVLGEQLLAPSREDYDRVKASGGTPTYFTNTLRYLQAYWALLGQRVTNPHIEQLPKSRAKVAKRMGLPPRVTVIQLRAIEARRSDGETLVEWSHRWVVKGHWRWQPYGSRRGLAHEHVWSNPRVDGGVLVKECTVTGCDGYIERIWIAPYVKGPDGKPLIVSDKVYALSR